MVHVASTTQRDECGSSTMPQASTLESLPAMPTSLMLHRTDMGHQGANKDNESRARARDAQVGTGWQALTAQLLWPSANHVWQYSRSCMLSCLLSLAIDHQPSESHRPALLSITSLPTPSTLSHHAPLQDSPLVSSILRVLPIASDHPCVWTLGSP